MVEQQPFYWTSFLFSNTQIWWESHQLLQLHQTELILGKLFFFVVVVANSAASVCEIQSDGDHRVLPDIQSSCCKWHGCSSYPCTEKQNNKDLVDKETASRSLLSHPAVERKKKMKDVSWVFAKNFGMCLDYSRTGEIKIKKHTARLSGSVCSSDAVLYSWEVSWAEAGTPIEGAGTRGEWFPTMALC